MRGRLLPDLEEAPIVHLSERVISFDVNVKRKKGACRLSRKEGVPFS